MIGLVVAGLLKEINVFDGLINQFSQCNQRIARTQGRASSHDRSGWRKLILLCCGNAGSAISPIDLGNPSAIDAEIGRDVVLSIASKQHPLHNRDFTVVQGHKESLQLQCRDYATDLFCPPSVVA